MSQNVMCLNVFKVADNFVLGAVLVNDQALLFLFEYKEVEIFPAFS
jgi:hypothetical protein